MTPPTLESVLAALGRAHPDADPSVVTRVWPVAERALRGRYRRCGETVGQHCLAVAQSMADWGYSPTAVAAAIVHDLPEAGPWRSRRGMRRLPPDVRRLVEDLHRLDTGGVAPGPAGLEIGGDRKPGDPVLVIKLADRLENARTWAFVPLEHARIRAGDTRDRMVPWALAAGLTTVAAELAELSERTLTAAPLPTAGRRAPRPSPRRGRGEEDLAVRVLGRALAALPPTERERYRREWAADLSTLEVPGERVRFALGLRWSARQIRRDRGPDSG